MYLASITEQRQLSYNSTQKMLRFELMDKLLLAESPFYFFLYDIIYNETKILRPVWLPAIAAKVAGGL